MLIAFALATACRRPRAAEIAEINVAQQYGIGYLPLMVMEEQKLIEKHAKAAGVDVKVNWAKFAGGNVMNDALLSGSLQFASGGVGPLVTLWARTKGNLDVKGVGGDQLDAALPQHAQSERQVDQGLHRQGPDRAAGGQGVDPGRDAADGGREGVRRRAAEQLDPLTVSMSHPDAQAALLSGHRRSPRTSARRRSSTSSSQRPGIHTVLNSYEVLGGPATFNVVWTTSKFRNENPKLYDAFVKALDEATAQINKRQARGGGSVPAHLEGQGQRRRTSSRC